MIENPVLIRKRSFRTPLAAQWWRFFNYLGIRCPALRSVETGKRWPTVDFVLPTLDVAVVATPDAAEIDLNTCLEWGMPLLTLGDIPDPTEEGEWCWPYLTSGADRLSYFSFRNIAQTGELFLGHRLSTTEAALCTPRLDLSWEPDLEVRRAYWVARNGAAKHTGRRCTFGKPEAFGTLQAPAEPAAATPVPAEMLVEPDPADFPPSGPKVLVYQHFDADGVLVYIGISEQPTRRTKVHAAYSDWVAFAQTMTGTWCNSRVHAEAVEEYLIRTLRPIFNVQHNDGPEARERRSTYLTRKGQPDPLGRVA